VGSEPTELAAALGLQIGTRYSVFLRTPGNPVNITEAAAEPDPVLDETGEVLDQREPSAIIKPDGTDGIYIWALNRPATISVGPAD